MIGLKLRRWAWYSLVLFTFMCWMVFANDMLWWAMTGEYLDIDIDRFVDTYFRRAW